MQQLDGVLAALVMSIFARPLAKYLVSRVSRYVCAYNCAAHDVVAGVVLAREQ